MKTNNNIGIVFDDLTEFFVMRPVIDRLQKESIPTDIIVPHDSGYNGLADHTFQKIKSLGYSPKNDTPKNKHYKTLLVPYHLPIIDRTNHSYLIQYSYGAISSKPNPTYQPSYHIIYDAVFSFDTYSNDNLEAYGTKNYILPYWRYHNFKKHTKSGKPILLILPTFGADTSCIDLLTPALISELKQHFNIIIKAHHATHFDMDGKNQLSHLHDIADEVYDSDTPIDQLLSSADYALSDNSGAIFESICAGVPIAVFSPDLNSRHLGKIDTPQYTFAKQGFIPHAKKSNQVLPTLLSLDKYASKQSALKNQLFLKTPKDPVAPALGIIKTYLSSDPDQDLRKISHSLLVKEWQDKDATIESQSRTIEQLNRQIEEIHSSTSWKITRPLRKMKFWSK